MQTDAEEGCFLQGGPFTAPVCVDFGPSVIVVLVNMTVMAVTQYINP